MNTGFFGKKWTYSARGPVWENENLDAAKFLVSEIAKRLQKSGEVFWRADPYTKEPGILDPGFGFKSRPATQNYQPTDTLELDLKKSEEELLAEMKRKGRYNIRLAEKHNVKFRKTESANFSQKTLDAFWSLNLETTGRDEFSGHEKSYYEKFLKSLPEHAVLFLAEKDETPIAGAITTFCGKKAIYYFGASTSAPRFRPLMAPYGLQWEMIREAKKRGCESYDFLGIAPENEPKHAYAGISEFKWKFGGARKKYLPGREIVFRKFWYALYRVAKKFR